MCDDKIIKCKVITNWNLYNKVRKNAKFYDISINKYLKSLFLDKSICFKCSFKNLVKDLNYINSLGQNINFIATKINLKKSITKIDLENLDLVISKLENTLENILKLELINLNIYDNNFETNPKKYILRFRLYSSEYKFLNKKIKDFGFIKMNDYFNSILKSRYYIIFPKKFLVQLLFEIQKIEVNLKQINVFLEEEYFRNIFEKTEKFKERINLYLRF